MSSSGNVASENANAPGSVSRRVIPSSCGFGYKYQKSVASFTMAMDLVDIIMEDIQMSIKDRMEALKKSQERLVQAQMDIVSLSSDIINYNL